MFPVSSFMIKRFMFHVLSSMLHKHRAQSLLEALLSIALGVILIGGSVGLIGVSLRSFNSVKQHLQANSLMRQTAEIIQSLARDNWHKIYDLYPGIHYKPVKHDNTYVIQKGEEKIFDSQNLVSYWSFDEATSTIAYDNQSTNNGTLYNGPTWQAESNCVSGSCLEFNGSNNYVDVPNSASLNFGTSSFSYSIWVYVPQSVGVFDMPIYKGGASMDQIGYDMELGTGSWNANISDGTSTPRVDFENETLNNWIYLAVVIDKSQDKMFGYENGSLTDSTDITGFGSVSSEINLRLSGDSYSSYPFKGFIDEVRIYNRALSADEIKTHYQAGLDKLGLVSYWALDENGGTLAYDNQSTNNGTLYNSPVWQAESNCVSGSCLSFDGTNDYMDTNSISLMSGATIGAIEAWVKINALGTPYASIRNAIVGKASSPDNAFGFSNTENKLRLRLGNVVNLDSISTISVGQWYHVVGTWDSLGMKIYINGVLDNSNTNVVSWYDNLNLPTVIGRIYTGSTGGSFNGLIDEVRIYNRALTADEIAQRYQASYTKYFVTNKISRTSGTIDTTYNSANDDSSTLKINSVIKYGRGLVSQQTGGIADVRFYFTRSYNNQTFWQTDWSEGSDQSGPISNPGNKFDTADSNINYASTIGSIYMTTPTSTVASLTSSILDTGVSEGAGFNSLLWLGNLGTNGNVKFQIAFSNSSSTVNTYYGPTSTSDYYQPNPNVSIAFPTTASSSPQNMRYIRYKVYLSTASTTPQINDIIINWSP
jgi:hypothetical protein